MPNRFLTAVLLCLTLVVQTSIAQEGRQGRRDGQRLPAAQQPPQGPGQPQTQPAPSQGEKPADKPADKAGDRLVTTDHEIAVNGNSLRYRATAGTLAMKDESGKHKADVFFVAYEKRSDADRDIKPDEKKPDEKKEDDKAAPDKTPAVKPPAPNLRPVTFVFNGGPGAAAVWLHLGTAGPKRVRLAPEGEVPPPPYGLVDNESTWLDATDLVFIDPVGTGYSRPAPGEAREQFHGVQEDIRWVADFIRLYTTRYNRWPSPKFLAGESYGTTRAAGLSEYLLDQHGINLNGIILVSVVLDFGTISFGGGNDLPYALFLPSYTAAAHHHKKLPQDLQSDLKKALAEAEQYALGEYLTVLAQGTAISPEQRAAAARRIARYSGLREQDVEKAELRVDPELFRTLLLEDRRQLIGRFDTRLTAYDRQLLRHDAELDPSYSPYLAAYAGGFNDYVRRELRFESDLPYEVLTGRVQPWNFGQGGSGYTYTAQNLRNAMIKNPHLKILVASGFHDLATPFVGTKYTVDHLDVGPELRGNVTETFYAGGHMMYHRREALEQLDRDVTEFIQRALGTGVGTAGADTKPPATP